ncbi:MAG: hypothetical protein V7750_02250 [Sneathiella sp.]
MSISDSNKAGQNDRQNEMVDKSPIVSARTEKVVLSDMENIGQANQAVSQEAYDVGFMMDDQDELVDLDSLFDALNIAAEEGVDAIGYVSGSEGSSGVLTVTNEALAAAGVSASMDDVNAVADHGRADPVISDES